MESEIRRQVARRLSFMGRIIPVMGLTLFSCLVQAAQFAYIPNSNSNNVSVINTATNTIAATVPVGNKPTGVAVHPSGLKAYVTNGLSNTVSVIDANTNAVAATIPAGPVPLGVALNPSGTRLYVTNYLGGTVSVFDAATNAFLATVPVGSQPGGIDVHPAGSFVYVANSNSSTVSVINTAGNAVVATIPVGPKPAAVGVHPSGALAYVASQNDDSVAVINTVSNTVLTFIPVGLKPGGIAVHPAGSFVYVSNFDDGTVSVINTASNTVVATIPVGSAPGGIAVNPSGVTAYVANGADGTVSVISTATNTVTATVAVGVNPTALGRFVGPVFAGTGLGLDVSMLNFGEQAVGTTSAAKVVTVTNVGESPRTFSSFSVIGANPGDFSLDFAAGTCDDSAILGVGASCTLVVKFTPGVLGARSANLQILSDAAGSPHVVALLGEGVEATLDLGIDPPFLNFGNQVVGTTSGGLTAMVLNIGTAGIQYFSVSIAGADSADFQIDAGASTCSTSGGVIEVRGSCTVVVKFTPAATGSRSASLVVANEGSSSPNTIPLDGTGVDGSAPVLDIDTSVLNFGNQLVGTTSPSQMVTLTNLGNAALELGSIAIVGPNAAEFGIDLATSSCDDVANLAPNAACNVVVTFTPSAIGPRGASIEIASNAPGSPHNVVLAGTGTSVPEPALSIDVPNLGFGNQLVGTTSAGQMATLTNIGAGTLAFGSISLGGSQPGDYFLDLAAGTCDDSLTLAAGASCTVVVKFAPTAVGVRSAAIVVTSDAAGSPHAVILTGTGVTGGPEPTRTLVLSDYDLDFGSHAVGSTGGPLTTTLFNTGTGAVTIGSITTSAPFGVTHTCAASLAAGASCLIHATFKPETLGVAYGNVTINSDANGNPHSVALSGVGVAPAGPPPAPPEPPVPAPPAPAPSVIISVNNQAGGGGLIAAHTNPVKVTYDTAGCEGKEMFLILKVVGWGMGWWYVNAQNKLVPLPANLAQVMPYMISGPYDGTHTLYQGSVPAGDFEIYLGCDNVRDGHLTIDLNHNVNGVYGYAFGTVQ